MTGSRSHFISISFLSTFPKSVCIYHIFLHLIKLLLVEKQSLACVFDLGDSVDINKVNEIKQSFLKTKMKISSLKVSQQNNSNDDDVSESLSHDGGSDVKSNHTGSCAFTEDNFDQKTRHITFSEQEGVEKLIERETREVTLWRTIVALMLVSTAALVTFYTYEFLENEDQRKFDVSVSTQQ
jgi:hypothetical protein